MATRLSVSLSGDLDVRQDSATCPGSTTSAGLGFSFSILDANRSAYLEISQNLASVDASGGAVALPFPANLEGTLLYLRVVSGGPLDVSVTYATQGATVHPVKGLLVIEPADDERITGVSVTSGSGDIEWAVTGLEV